MLDIATENLHFSRMIKVFIYCVAVTIFSLLRTDADELKNLEPLTANADIWRSSYDQYARKFSEIRWKYIEGSGDYVHESKGMTLWGEPVHKIDLKEEDGVITSLKFTVLEQGTALFMKKNQFDAEVARWNKIVTERLRSEGKRVASISVGKVKHLRMAWDCQDSVVVLSANIGLRPDRIELICYERDFGLKQLALIGLQRDNQLMDKSYKDVTLTADTEADDQSEDDGFAPSEAKKKIHSKIKEIEARKAPNGISKEVQSAVNLLNVYRFLSRVPYDVKADKTMVAAAQDAARACREEGRLSHDLGHSTDRCNLAMNSGNLSMKSSVMQYMQDSGANNRERRGHRRWCINHKMGKTGFGIDGAYSAMYAMDQSERGTRKNYSYPGHGFYPVKYLHGNGWSYHSVKGAIPQDCQVQVWKLKKFQEKSPKWSNEPEGKSLPCEFKFIYSDTMVFEPEPEATTRKGTYLVRLKGSGLKEQYLVHLY